ncbi:MAG: PTS sugar transporter subunit IIA [Acidobacteriota bacterium]
MLRSEPESTVWTFVSRISKRNGEATTGIGKGVAIPHGRTTATAEVRIAFGHSKEGIDFGAVDDRPVHLIFMVLAPPVEEDNRYLPILGKLVETLSDDSKRQQLSQVGSFQEFLEAFEDGGTKK